MPEVVPAGVLWRSGPKVAVVKAVAGASISAKLLPQLTEFKSLGDPKPESIELLKELGLAGCAWRRRAGRGLYLRGIHQRSLVAAIIEAREGNRSKEEDMRT
jgi:hypothetical protein